MLVIKLAIACCTCHMSSAWVTSYRGPACSSLQRLHATECCLKRSRAKSENPSPRLLRFVVGVVFVIRVTAIQSTRMWQTYYVLRTCDRECMCDSHRRQCRRHPVSANIVKLGSTCSLLNSSHRPHAHMQVPTQTRVYVQRCKRNSERDSSSTLWHPYL
jgi:hypothetical protein